MKILIGRISMPIVLSRATQSMGTTDGSLNIGTQAAHGESSAFHPNPGCLNEEIQFLELTIIGIQHNIVATIAVAQDIFLNHAKTAQCAPIFSNLQAVTMQNVINNESGFLEFVKRNKPADSCRLSNVIVRPRPDSRAFSAAGRKAPCSNEGEPNKTCAIDLEGPIFIINISGCQGDTPRAPDQGDGPIISAAHNPWHGIPRSIPADQKTLPLASHGAVIGAVPIVNLPAIDSSNRLTHRVSEAMPPNTSDGLLHADLQSPLYKAANFASIVKQPKRHDKLQGWFGHERNPRTPGIFSLSDGTASCINSLVRHVQLLAREGDCREYPLDVGRVPSDVIRFTAEKLSTNPAFRGHPTLVAVNAAHLAERGIRRSRLQLLNDTGDHDGDGLINMVTTMACGTDRHFDHKGNGVMDSGKTVDHPTRPGHGGNSRSRDDGKRSEPEMGWQSLPTKSSSPLGFWLAFSIDSSRLDGSRSNMTTADTIRKDPLLPLLACAGFLLPRLPWKRG